jgi:hypothetical protein
MPAARVAERRRRIADPTISVSLCLCGKKMSQKMSRRKSRRIRGRARVPVPSASSEGTMDPARYARREAGAPPKIVTAPPSKG